MLSQGYKQETLINHGNVASISEIGCSREDGSAASPTPNKLFSFIDELRRRRVCRAATMYVITLWLIAQIIDVVSEGFGLPEWTMRVVVILGLTGFPIALILSWLFEITPDGRGRMVGAAEPAARRSADKVVDCGLLAVALVIGTQLAIGPLPSSDVGAPRPERVAVESFRAASGGGADVFSVGLANELQHRLVLRADTEVVSLDTVTLNKDWRRLSGTVAIDDTHVRVTVNLVDGMTGTVIWSQIFERERMDFLSDQSILAEQIVRVIPRELTAIAQS